MNNKWTLNAICMYILLFNQGNALSRTNENPSFFFNYCWFVLLLFQCYWWYIIGKVFRLGSLLQIIQHNNNLYRIYFNIGERREQKWNFQFMDLSKIAFQELKSPIYVYRVYAVRGYGVSFGKKNTIKLTWSPWPFSIQTVSSIFSLVLLNWFAVLSIERTLLTTWNKEFCFLFFLLKQRSITNARIGFQLITERAKKQNVFHCSNSNWIKLHKFNIETPRITYQFMILFAELAFGVLNSENQCFIWPPGIVHNFKKHLLNFNK